MTQSEQWQVCLLACSNLVRMGVAVLPDIYTARLILSSVEAFLAPGFCACAEVTKKRRVGLVQPRLAYIRPQARAKLILRSRCAQQTSLVGLTGRTWRLGYVFAPVSWNFKRSPPC